jgi:aryl-alcohol dehydrogenase-like predicted oxidoreductase
LRKPEELSSYFDSIKNLLGDYHDYLKLKQVTPLQSALNFVMDQPEVDCAILGVASEHEFFEIRDAVKKAAFLEMEYNRFACGDEKIVNPTYWKGN